MWFFLAFYHCRIAVAEYTIDGVPEMNMRPSWMKNPSVGANKIIDDCHDREYTWLPCGNNSIRRPAEDEERNVDDGHFQGFQHRSLRRS